MSIHNIGFLFTEKIILELSPKKLFLSNSSENGYIFQYADLNDTKNKELLQDNVPRLIRALPLKL